MPSLCVLPVFLKFIILLTCSYICFAIGLHLFMEHFSHWPGGQTAAQNPGLDSLPVVRSKCGTDCDLSSLSSLSSADVSRLCRSADCHGAGAGRFWEAEGLAQNWCSKSAVPDLPTVSHGKENHDTFHDCLFSATDSEYVQRHVCSVKRKDQWELSEDEKAHAGWVE